MPIGYIWQTFLETPLINFMVALSVLTFGSFGLAILLFTVISRGILFPLTLRTMHSMKAVQELQPRIQEIQKKHSDPRRRSEETMKLYREAGVNPLGCLGPQLVQLPIFIALYSVIRITLAPTPEAVISLSDRLYGIDMLQDAIPLSTHFLFIDLQANGNIFLVMLVFASMWLQQRITTSRSQVSTQSPQQQQMQTMMQWMMPALFAWIVLGVPAGLGLYWAASTIIGIVLQWIFVGPGDFTWRSLVPSAVRGPLGMEPQRPGSTRTATSTAIHPGGEPEARDQHADSRNQREDGRRGRRSGTRSTRTSSRSGRRRRHPRG